MSNESERQIEKLLRAAAAKRREQATRPFDLHPATRRLLQGEVARRFPLSGRRAIDKSLWLRVFWRRLAWSLGLAVVLGAGLWVALESNQSGPSSSMEMASRTIRDLAPAAETSPSPPAAPSVEAPAASLVPPPVPAAGLDRSLADASTAAKKTEATGQEARQRANLRAETATEGDSQQMFARRYGLATPPQKDKIDAWGGGVSVRTNPGPATFAPTQVAAAPTMDAIAVGGPNATSSESPRSKAADERTATLRRSPSPLTQNGQIDIYRRITAGENPRSELDDRPNSQILALFTVERKGDDLRIVDADGSVYAGIVDRPPAGFTPSRGLGAATTPGSTATRYAEPAVRTDTMPKPAAVKPTAAAQADGFFSFRVSGTNKTLGKQVIFIGNLSPAAATVGSLGSASEVGSAVSNRTTNLALGSPMQAPPGNILRGRVVVGDGKEELQIQAVSPSRR